MTKLEFLAKRKGKEMRYEVLTMEGMVIGVFDTEDKAHEFADEYGDATGRFAYVEQAQERIPND